MHLPRFYDKIALPSVDRRGIGPDFGGSIVDLWSLVFLAWPRRSTVDLCDENDDVAYGGLVGVFLATLIPGTQSAHAGHLALVSGVLMILGGSSSENWHLFGGLHWRV